MDTFPNRARGRGRIPRLKAATWALALAACAALAGASAAAAAGGYDVMVSFSSDRAAAIPLQGQAVTGSIYVFTSPDAGIAASSANRVEFFLDDPAMAAGPIHRERRAPFDFVGGSLSNAQPLNADSLVPGAHTITARLPLADGSTAVIHANFVAGAASGNSPPVISSIAPQSMEGATAASIPIQADDPDGDQIVLDAQSLPRFATLFDNGDGTGNLDVSPGLGDVGNYKMTVTASDQELSDSETIDLSVVQAGDGKVLVIVSQPRAQTVTEGQSATFAVAVDGTGPFTFQWRANGADVPGATGDTHVTGPLSLSDSGTRVSVVVGDTRTSLTSDEAVLSVRASSSLTVDRDNPSWLRYADGSPFFMCSAGDPEGFLYRGRRNADGTRNGDQMAIIDKLAASGANGLYIQIVRSHGGDGTANHNPFVGSDPAKGLDEDILNQWETWFTAMDDAGIVAYLFFFDDHARIWSAGDAVPAAEAAFLRAIVNRFQHHRNLVWVIAEEYQEAFTPRRVSNMAAIIRAADGASHPIAVHKLDGLSFSEFADDPNIDQYAIQYNNVSETAMHDAMASAFADAGGRYSLNMAESAGHGTGTTARLKNWAAAMGGAYVMVLDWDVATTSRSDLEGCGRLVQFMESTGMNGLAPRDDLAYAGTAYVLAGPPNSYVLYAASGSGAMGVRGLVGDTYDLRWLDIVSGAVVEQTGVAISGGDTSWPRPAGIGAEAALFVARAGAGGPPDPGNTGPIARIAATPTTGGAPLAVAFDATGSSDADGRIATYAWDFGDGASDRGAVANHTYDQPGAYTAMLTVTDDGGALARATVRIEVGGGTGTSHSLLFSYAASRDQPAPLSGQSVAGLIYVFVSPEEGIVTTSASRLRFYLDDPTMAGAPVQLERRAPYDFAGGSSSAADPFDTRVLPRGFHTITAALPMADGTTKVIHAVFAVAN